MRKERGVGEVGRGAGRVLAVLLLGAASARLPGAAAQDAPPPPAAPAAAQAGAVTGAEDRKEQPPSRWTNSTELSLVVTDGNSSVQTFGLKDTLEYRSTKGRSRLRIDALQSDTSDDPYYLVEPGLTFEPGETIADPPTRAVRPGADPDVARFFAEGRYEGDLPKKATWNAGASWDMNDDAGIVSRTIVFGGMGHVWRDREDLKFRTTYGASFTDRMEEVEDPLKDQRFPGVRLSSFYRDRWGKATIYENDFTFNINVADLSDYNADFVQSLSVGISDHLSLKVSLQFTYSGEPALEEVDVFVRAVLVDPDGIPGNGDEFYETVDSGGVEVKIGEDTLRKEALDTTFRTSLQITY